jgi:MoaA/NifB/PqqE/SkfB family radical SAM enzyme
MTRTVDAPLPEELYLEVTNRCNLRCKTCPQFSGMPEQFHDLTWDDFIGTTDQLPALRRVVLHGIGEPLLHPDLPRMIRHLKARGAYVLFNTNGLLLRGRRAADLASSGLDELRISIDGGSAETYRLIRGVDGFDRIVANVTAFRALKERLAVATPRLSLWVTGMRANAGDLPRLVRLAAEIGVEEVYLQRLVFSGNGLATREQSIHGMVDSAARSAVDDATALAAELGVTVRGSGDFGGAEPDAPGEASWRGCSRPWRLTYVTANGNLLPCCIAPFTGVPYDSIVLGNLTTQPLAAAWNGDGYRRWRTAMLAGTPPDACRGCGADWSL